MEDTSTQAAEEITMQANERTTASGTPIGVNRARDTRRWYQPLKTWWAEHRAAHRAAHLTALRAGWDARREAVRPSPADAAIDLAAPAHAGSTIIALSSLSV
jgi:hypothetical protein